MKAIKQKDGSYKFGDFTIVKSTISYINKHSLNVTQQVRKVYNKDGDEICASPFNTKKEALTLLSK